MSKLPIELQTLIAAGLGYLVTEGLKSLSKLLKADLGGSAAAIAGAITTAILLFADALIMAIPEQYAGAVQAALGLVVAIFSAFGIHRQFKRFSL